MQNFKKIKKSNNGKILNILLTPHNSHGQKLNEELISRSEKIYYFYDDTYVSTDLPKNKNNITNKLLSSKSINKIKQLLQKVLEIINFQKKFLVLAKLFSLTYKFT